MAIAATTPTIEPLAVHALVTADFANMTLVVRRPKDATGYPAFLWRQSHEQLVKAEEAGWPASTSFLWASAPGRFQFGRVTPGANLTLLVGFVPGTENARIYAELVSQPLSAYVVADKSTRRFMNVTFRHNR